ncbi:MAG: hypothetical protein J0L92_12475 [Deltaproteobacteria bacterium]|nr:hypothetical protein [Deltaproteobacteria bacterium]
MARRPDERSESWALEANTATVLWYVDPREGADVIFLRDPSGERPLTPPTKRASRARVGGG